MQAFPQNRRDFLSASTAGLAGAGMVSMLSASEKEHPPMPVGKAEHCIMIWLGGGACQIDTWDPKRMGDAKAKKPGSYYPAIDTAIPGVPGPV